MPCYIADLLVSNHTFCHDGCLPVFFFHLQHHYHIFVVDFKRLSGFPVSPERKYFWKIDYTNAWKGCFMFRLIVEFAWEFRNHTLFICEWVCVCVRVSCEQISIFRADLCVSLWVSKAERMLGECDTRSSFRRIDVTISRLKPAHTHSPTPLRQSGAANWSDGVILQTLSHIQPRKCTHPWACAHSDKQNVSATWK